MSALLDAQLLEDISENSVSGENLRDDDSLSSIYFQLKEKRSQARENERQLIQNGRQDVIALTDWKEVQALCINILKSKSKDLEVLAWLIEASIRVESFKGLTLSLKLALGLINKYWDTIYPLNTEDEASDRVVSFAGLNGFDSPGTLVFAINCVPLLHDESGNPIALWHIQQANRSDGSSNKNTQANSSAKGSSDYEKIKKDASTFPQGHFEALKSEIAESIDAVEQLYQEIANKLKLDSTNAQTGDCPQSNYIRDALRQCLNAVTEFIKKQNNDETSSDAKSEIVRTTVKVSREGAFQLLQEASIFFRENEPLSPVSYLLDKVIHWGNLTLPELTQEIMSDNQLYYGYCHMIGAPIQSKSKIQPDQYPQNFN